MPSSISSSNFDPPSKPWGAVLLVAVLLTAMMGFGLEMVWRARGYSPGVVDSPSLWALEREELEEADKTHIAIVGSSRFQTGLDPAVMKQNAPGYEFHQVAVAAGNPLLLLYDLADDDSFAGIVLFEFAPDRFAMVNPAAMARAKSMLAGYHKAQLVDRPERMARTFLQSRLVLLHEALNIKRLLRDGVLTRQLPEPSRTMLPTRFVDTTRTTPEEAKRALKRNLDELKHSDFHSRAEIYGQFREMADATRAIRARGGDVVFLRPNSSLEIETLENDLFPRDQYYEKARQMIGGTWLHYEDDPVLRDDVNVPDGVHAMGEGATIMSRRVAELLFAD